MTLKNIAIASGKGGTGKTTVSLALSFALSKSHSVTLADCDVEEPNCALFLDQQTTHESDYSVPDYLFDKDKCIRCGKCVDVCRFNAIALTKTIPIVFTDLCHGCGGCVLSCPAHAITESKRVAGQISRIECNGFQLLSGKLSIGEAMASPMIRSVKAKLDPQSVNIIDCPPGASCSMLAATQNCALTFLVTEPTPFGLNDLKMAVRALRESKQPFEVVINRDGIGDNGVKDYCKNEGISITATIPFDKEVAKYYSRGELPYQKVQTFTDAINTIAVRAEEALEI